MPPSTLESKINNKMYLFPPLDGFLIKNFSIEDNHYGIDIVSLKSKTIQSVADGIVIIASWTIDNGYTIALQHRNNLVSIYKHKSVLFKEVGDII